MQDDILRRFNGDLNTKEALVNFIIEVINDEALEKMYKGESVAHIKDAKNLIDKAFQQLDILYGINIQQTKNTNQAK